MTVRDLEYTAGMRTTTRNGLCLATTLALVHCAPTTTGQPGPAGPGYPATTSTAAPGTTTSAPPPLAATAAPAPAATSPAPAPAGTLEERHVSRSPGVAGGVTILWPRIIPRDIVDENRDLAAALQQQMKILVEKHLPGRAIDFRPEPERVCPKTGCAGASVGLLLSRQGQGCLVLALVSRPGVSPTRIVPWVGKVQLRGDTVGFREWPESQITVADYIPCSSLLTTMDAQEAAIAAALKAAAQ